MEERASKYWKYFVDQVIFYQSLFENSGDIYNLLKLPYPFFRDIILAQVSEKKREQKMLEERAKGKYNKAITRKGPIRHGKRN